MKQEMKKEIPNKPLFHFIWTMVAIVGFKFSSSFAPSIFLHFGPSVVLNMNRRFRWRTEGLIRRGSNPYICICMYILYYIYLYTAFLRAFRIIFYKWTEKKHHKTKKNMRPWLKWIYESIESRHAIHATTYVL